MQTRHLDARVTMGKWAVLLLVLVAALVYTNHPLAATTGQKTFATPEEAASALVQAVKSHDRKAVLAVLGDAGDALSSGDPVADRALGERFAAAYDAKHSLAAHGDGMQLIVGNDEFPFAFPLVKSGDRWRFDTAAGKDEMLARRIGENELYAINVLRAIVDAQRDYATADRNGDGVFDYARKFASAPGKHDGLYWPTKVGEPASPLGELVAGASAEGYRAKQGRPAPFHGYNYRMLKGQGKNAAGGALDYVVHGRAIGGFAVVAYPAKYGNSGVMTFVVNQEGKVFQADLGPGTQAKASAMQLFDPGPAWSPVAAK